MEEAKHRLDGVVSISVPVHEGKLCDNWVIEQFTHHESVFHKHLKANASASPLQASRWPSHWDPQRSPMGVICLTGMQNHLAQKLRGQSWMCWVMKWGEAKARLKIFALGNSKKMWQRVRGPVCQYGRKLICSSAPGTSCFFHVQDNGAQKPDYNLSELPWGKPANPYSTGIYR